MGGAYVFFKNAGEDYAEKLRRKNKITDSKDFYNGLHRNILCNRYLFAGRSRCDRMGRTSFGNKVDA